jgi:hypothetical protein
MYFVQNFAIAPSAVFAVYKQPANPPHPRLHDVAAADELSVPRSGFLRQMKIP